MHYRLGIDLGTSFVKVALVEAVSGKKTHVVSAPDREMEILSTQSGWAEQDPIVWWRNCCAAIQRVITESRVDSAKIVSIGVSYQMHGLVLVDQFGEPLRNAIIWCDNRAIEIGDEIYAAVGPEKCLEHLLNSPGNFTISKLKWVKDNEPELYNNIHKWMLPGDYIVYKLTGQFTTTKNGLSECVLWDFKLDKPAYWLLDFLNINQTTMPEIVENFSEQGCISSKAAEETTLVKGVPVNYRAGDQLNNAFSLAVQKPGEVAATGGTSGVIYALSDQIESNEPLKINHFAHINHTLKTPIIGKLLCVNGSGILYKWLRSITSQNDYKQMNYEASSIPVGAEGLTVLPFGNGAERMLDNKDIGAHFCNFNFNKHDRAHLYCAALEGIAFSFVYGLEILTKNDVTINTIRVGNDNLFQSELFSNTIANLVGCEIEVVNTTGAVGAAQASSLTDENSIESIKHIILKERHLTYAPSQITTELHKAYENWKYELYTRLNFYK